MHVKPIYVLCKLFAFVYIKFKCQKKKEESAGSWHKTFCVFLYIIFYVYLLMEYYFVMMIRRRKNLSSQLNAGYQVKGSFISFSLFFLNYFFLFAYICEHWNNINWQWNYVKCVNRGWRDQGWGFFLQFTWKYLFWRTFIYP